MRLIGLTVVLALSLILTPLVVQAQQAGRVHRIAVLVVPEGFQSNVDAFRDGMRALGYTEGKNVIIEYREAGGRYERLPELASDLLRLNPEAIVTSTVPGIRAVERLSKTIPIVMATVGDAVETGVVSSLAQPGGNITGLSIFVPELAAKRLELMNEAIPNLSRVGLIMNPDNPGHRRPQMLMPFWTMARSLKVDVERADVRGRQDLGEVFTTMAKRKVQAVVVLEDGVLNSHPDAIGDLARRSRIAAIGFKPLAIAGGLMAFGPSHSDMWRRAATFVHKILNGAKPADLPVEQPTKFELVINLKTAKALGLTIPQSVLLRADQIIE
jgi:putative tryptophan/tyrosine transport system substrate-binding protein